MKRLTASDFDQELLDIYDEYVHGQTDRRGFLNRATKFAVGGVTAATLLDSLTPDYALAQQIAEDDERIAAEYTAYPSPKGHEKTRGYLVQPAKVAGKVPGVLVIHENRGLNPYVADVARRVGAGSCSESWIGRR
jgi:carboxymethylenebutenolidase